MVTHTNILLLLLYSQILSISTKFDLTNNLASYQLIHKSQLSHNIVKRGATLSTHKYNQIREIDFKALGRDFRLILSPKKGLLSSNFRAVELDDEEKEHHVAIDQDSFYDGRVFGESKSRAQVHMEDGVITANIETADEIYHIEPSWRHLPETDDQTMIAYKESDIKLSWNSQMRMISFHIKLVTLSRRMGQLRWKRTIRRLRERE